VAFNEMPGTMGAGGPAVDTVLDRPGCRPGEMLLGEVHVLGRTVPAAIGHIALGLVTSVPADGSRGRSTVEAHTARVAGAFNLAPGERRRIPFQFRVPWQTPVTTVYGQRLPGMTMGLRTELSVAGAVGQGDLDPVSIHPLPAQERILQAFGELGFQFKNADLRSGRLPGVEQRLPFRQEFAFYPPPHVPGVDEVEVTFVAGPHGMDVILEADNRVSHLTGGDPTGGDSAGGNSAGDHDADGWLHVDYATAAGTDWAARIDVWLRQAALGSRAGFSALGGAYA
jgi:sporulation-control protein